MQYIIYFTNPSEITDRLGIDDNSEDRHYHTYKTTTLSIHSSIAQPQLQKAYTLCCHISEWDKKKSLNE